MLLITILNNSNVLCDAVSQRRELLAVAVKYSLSPCVPEEVCERKNYFDEAQLVALTRVRVIERVANESPCVSRTCPKYARCESRARYISETKFLDLF